MSNNTTTDNYIEEDEIDLRELWQIIFKGKKIIAAVIAVIVTFAFVYPLQQPNVYTSKMMLIPTSEDGGSSLAALAAIAGINIGGSGSITPDVAFNSLLDNYNFMKKFVEKNKIVAHYDDVNVDENYVFAFGFRGFYDMFKSTPDSEEEVDREQLTFDTVKLVKSAMSIISDKKTTLISVSYSDRDRTYPPLVIDAFLKDASAYLVGNNLRIIDKKLKYFSHEMQSADGFELRRSLSTIISNILQEKVMMKSKQFYQCDVLTQAIPANIKDKTKSKRGLILVVSFITSIILGIFLVFFLEFIKTNKEEDKPNE